MDQTWNLHFHSSLNRLKEKSQYRHVVMTEQAEEPWLIRNGKRMLNLASNNYLGLAEIDD